MGERPKKIEWNDLLTYQVGYISQTVPAGLLFAVAIQLKQNLLDVYTMMEGIPTPENPNPSPYFALTEEDEGGDDELHAG